MKTYARYTGYKDSFTASRIGNGWYEVTEERKERRPSGLHNMVKINGLWVKARYCELVQVF